MSLIYPHLEIWQLISEKTPTFPKKNCWKKILKLIFHLFGIFQLFNFKEEMLTALGWNPIFPRSFLFQKHNIQHIMHLFIICITTHPHTLCSAVWCICLLLCVAEVREVFAQVLSDLRILYTRIPVEMGLNSCPWLPAHLQQFYAQVEKDARDSIPVFTRHGIRSGGLSFCLWTKNEAETRFRGFSVHQTLGPDSDNIVSVCVF